MEQEKLTTKLWLLSGDNGSLEARLALPSARDTLYLSYYSLLVDKEARVYLATITGMASLTRNIRD
ncbi:hypothetical protein GTH32_01380 [Alteromonas sp. 345S023]|uniref:Uncharacterized protein n=1 Tax=Alteromonas profundi TaxID=2696062 RepID=A0A7X5LI84_9ALTE|nr:hypothetical protein [Alteromonas profundi]NDV89846.1 hypothetical protein [Alteromonas profundi]